MNILMDDDRYSSELYPMLFSSVVQLHDTILCLHCGEEAKPVEESFRTSESTRLIEKGHRCVCDAALKEMVRRVAFGIYGLQGFGHKEYTMIENPVVVENLLNKSKRWKASFSMCKPICPVITQGKVHLAEFVQAAGDPNEVSNSHPLRQFMHNVHVAMSDHVVENVQFHTDAAWDRLTAWNDAGWYITNEHL